MVRRWIAPLSVTLALAACSAGDDTTLAAPTTATTTTTAAPVTTTTTAAPTTTTEDPEIAAVRAAHLAYLAMFEVVGDPPDPDHPELARRATGDAYERLRANLAQDRLEGNRLVGGWESDIRSIEINGDEATVTDCLLDTGVLFAPNHEVIVPADTERALRTVRLRKADRRWIVWRLESPSPAVPCDA